MGLLCNNVSHWLGTHLESASYFLVKQHFEIISIVMPFLPTSRLIMTCTVGVMLPIFLSCIMQTSYACEKKFVPTIVLVHLNVVCFWKLEIRSPYWSWILFTVTIHICCGVSNKHQLYSSFNSLFWLTRKASKLHKLMGKLHNGPGMQKMFPCH